MSEESTPEPKIMKCKLEHQSAKGTRLRSPVTLKFEGGRIYFIKSPYAMKDEIKAFAGSRWHGFDEKNPKKIWSIEDSFRNNFNLHYMMGENVYQHFDQPLIEHEYSRPLMDHQIDMANAGLTYHYQIWGAEMGLGKTLSAQEVIERAQVPLWYWVGPKTSLPNIRREFRKWGFDESSAVIEYMTYERLVRTMDGRSPDDPVPNGVIFDESSRCKTPTSQRSLAALALSDLIRMTYGFEGYVILMSGTPSPKRPTDWWSQAEITWPGFLREGNIKALEKRLAFQVQKTFDSGTFWTTIGWRDNEDKCAECGELYEDGPHVQDDMLDEEYHPYRSSKNEVALMFKRLQGLVRVYHKADCLTLPEKRYRKVVCKPKASIIRVGKTIVESAQNSMIGMTLLRELSDGFQYRDEDDGVKPCNHCPDACGEVVEWFDPGAAHKTYYDISLLPEKIISRLEQHKIKCPKCHGTGSMKKTKRVTREIPCPKEPALRGLLDECEETGRIVIFAGFTGSVDRCVRICHKEGWDVVRCDGRGFTVMRSNGEIVTDTEALDFWADLETNPRVAFVAHPESGGMSLTLVESRMIVYWSNSFKPEYRVQSEDRIHRKGMDENRGCVIVDLIHLPTDERVVDIIRDNRKLELMTMGKITDGLQWEGGES